MTVPSLPEKVVAIDRALDSVRISHAFGGALALAYYAEPRATIDIDVNVFVEPDAATPVWRALEEIGVNTQVDEEVVVRDGQCRIWWDTTPVDLFFAYDEIHDAMRRRARNVPFADGEIPILAPEHLAACKLAFDRAKDWIDIEQMLVTVEHFDIDDLLGWADRLVGTEDSRYQRIEDLIDRVRGSR